MSDRKHPSEGYFFPTWNLQAQISSPLLEILRPSSDLLSVIQGLEACALPSLETSNRLSIIPPNYCCKTNGVQKRDDLMPTVPSSHRSTEDSQSRDLNAQDAMCPSFSSSTSRQRHEALSRQASPYQDPWSSKA